MTQLDLDIAAASARRSEAATNGIPDYDGVVASEDGKYRFVLTRRWENDLPMAVWCLINPSTASATRDDMTSKKVRGFTKRQVRPNGKPIYGGYVLVNPYAFRATDISDLYAAHKLGFDVVGAENMEWVERAFRLSHDGRVFFGWGAKTGPRPEVIGAVIALAQKVGVTPYAFGVNISDGSPRHPQMTGYVTPLEKWSPR